MLDAGTALVEAELAALPKQRGRGVGAGHPVGPTIARDHADGVLSTAAQAVDQIEALEVRRRLIDAEQVALLDQIEASGVASQHGHASAKIMMAHVARLSGGEAAARDKTQRMLGRCDLLAEVYRTGELGVEQVRLLARVFANKRVRAAFVDCQQWFVDKATSLSFKRFERLIARWVDIQDQDGADPNARAHQDRNASLVQDHFTKTWQLTANGPALAGSQMAEILAAYITAEYDSDHAEATALFGDTVSKDQFARTDAQRRFDALHQIFLDAADNARPSGPAAVVHNIVWDHRTFEEMISRYAGATSTPFDIDGHRCATVDGHDLDPSETFANALNNHIRRVVINAKGVVIDMGHKSRLFTGLARTATRIARDECEWIGCHIPATHCQTDHITPWSPTSHSQSRTRGPTDQANAAVLCRKHNRHKQHGYTVTRQSDGELTITTPTSETLS